MSATAELIRRDFEACATVAEAVAALDRDGAIANSPEARQALELLPFRSYEMSEWRFRVGDPESSFGRPIRPTNGPMDPDIVDGKIVSCGIINLFVALKYCEPDLVRWYELNLAKGCIPIGHYSALGIPRDLCSGIDHGWGYTDPSRCAATLGCDAPRSQIFMAGFEYGYAAWKACDPDAKRVPWGEVCLQIQRRRMGFDPFAGHHGIPLSPHQLIHKPY